MLPNFFQNPCFFFFFCFLIFFSCFSVSHCISNVTIQGNFCVFCSKVLICLFSRWWGRGESLFYGRETILMPLVPHLQQKKTSECVFLGEGRRNRHARAARQMWPRFRPRTARGNPASTLWTAQTSPASVPRTAPGRAAARWAPAERAGASNMVMAAGHA